jgi:hypothetical protein
MFLRDIEQSPPLPSERWGELRLALRNDVVMMAFRSIRDMAEDMDKLSAIRLEDSVLGIAKRQGQIEGIRMVLDTLAEWTDDGK